MEAIATSPPSDCWFENLSGASAHTAPGGSDHTLGEFPEFPPETETGKLWVIKSFPVLEILEISFPEIWETLEILGS